MQADLLEEPVDIVRRAPPGGDGAANATFLASAAACLREHGAALLDDVIPRPIIDAALAHFQRAYSLYMRPGQRRLLRNFQDDPLRAQIPIAPAGAINNPLIYANPAVMALARVLLGEKVIVGEMGGVISHPGSKPQYTHRDSDFLFGGVPVDLEVPWWSFTIIIPLMDVPLECGPTEYWPGSHKALDSAAVTSRPPQCSPWRAGSIFAYSAQTLHRGGANVSSIVRPVIYITYQRPWYFERSGYEHKPQIRLSRAMLRAMTAEYRPLFSWALQINRTRDLIEVPISWAGRIRACLRQ